MAEIHVAGLVVREVEMPAPTCECGRHSFTVWVAAEENIDCWAVILVADPSLDIVEALQDDEWGDAAATVIVAYGVPWAELTPPVMQRQLVTVTLCSNAVAYALREVPLGELRALRRLVRGGERALGQALVIGQSYRESVQ